MGTHVAEQIYALIAENSAAENDPADTLLALVAYSKSAAHSDKTKTTMVAMMRVGSCRIFSDKYNTISADTAQLTQNSH